MLGSPEPYLDAPCGGAGPAGSNSAAGGGHKRYLADLPPSAGGRENPRTRGSTPSPAATQPSSGSGTAAAAEGAESRAAAAAAATAMPLAAEEAGPGQLDGCSHCSAVSSWRWRKHPDSQLRLCSACWDYLRAHGEERPVNVNCLRCGGSSPGTGRGVNGSWHAHPATGERWLCSPCFFLVRRQADKRQCMDCGADTPGACKSAVWHRSPGGDSWLCTRCHGRAYEQTKKLRRSALKRECEAAVTDWAAAEHSAQPRTRRQRAAMQQQERSGGGAAGATCTAASQPTTPSVMEAMEAAAGVLSGLARSQWAAPQDRQGQELQLASLGRGEQGEGWAEGQRAGQAGQHGGAQQQGAQLPPGGQARQLPPGDLFELLLSVADMTAGQGLTRPLVASFYSLLDGLPPEQKAVREWRLLRLLCEGSFPAAAQMMATALLLAGVPA